MEQEKIDYTEIASHFAFRGEIISIKPLGNGHINKTFLIKTSEHRYVLQQINVDVFPNIRALLNNVVAVTEHLKDKNVLTLQFIPTYQAKLYYHHDDKFFRMYKFIEHVYCYEGISDLDVVEKCGYAFGMLHNNLSDLNPNRIIDVIPNFHNTEKRYKDLLKAVSIDPVKRVESAKETLNFLADHSADFSLLVKGLEDGSINNAITHNDPKINNILFDKDTLDVRCVIDLDTVMQGTYLYDFGDALRSIFTGENEDTKDLSKLKVDFDIYKAYLTGYYSQMKFVLNKKEISLLPMSVIIITCELAIRFLTDYLNGDIYFTTNYPEHNYDRAMTQLTLAKDLYNNLDKLNAITEEICK